MSKNCKTVKLFNFKTRENIQLNLSLPSNVDSRSPFGEYHQAHERDERVVPPQDHYEHGACDKLSDTPQGKHEDDGVGGFLVKLRNQVHPSDQ